MSFRKKLDTVYYDVYEIRNESFDALRSLAYKINKTESIDKIISDHQLLLHLARQHLSSISNSFENVDFRQVWFQSYKHSYNLFFDWVKKRIPLNGCHIPKEDEPSQINKHLTRAITHYVCEKDLLNERKTTSKNS